MERCCARCAESKPIDGFPRKYAGVDDWHITCKACVTARKRDLVAKNPKKYSDRSRRYYAANKENILRSNAASRAKNRVKVLADKITYYNRVKLDTAWQENERKKRQANGAKKKAYDEKYRDDNREKCNLRSLDWSRRNKGKSLTIKKSYKARRRAVEIGGDSTKAIYGWECAQPKICYWCQIPCAADYHIDHYEPLSRGGKHEILNLVIACPSCNLRKNAKDPYKFAQQVGRLF